MYIYCKNQAKARAGAKIYKKLTTLFGQKKYFFLTFLFGVVKILLARLNLCAENLRKPVIYYLM